MVALFRAHRRTGCRRGQKLFGAPEFVFRRERVAVFVYGCFCHGCPKANHAPLPKNRAEWWAAKLGRNGERDPRRNAGCRVVRVCECDLGPNQWPRLAYRISRAVHAGLCGTKSPAVSRLR